ncbi:hypothetical protein [Chitinimonas sp.]|uniref:hypothetical protein n=1 Tax=Chitinimonas sp. TaxID=1934313 RepID=UPI002F93618E
MTAYVPAIIWLLSTVICLHIAKQRHIKPTHSWKMLVALLGPFAIPLVMAAKPEPVRRRIGR